MSDYIKREDVLQAIAGLLNVVEQIDSADVVEVVRCKDCKHRDPYDLKCDHGLMKTELPVGDDDYCSYGERKEK